MPDFSLGDYVDVNERLLWFFERYPEGSLQADILERGADFVVIKALAYRSPDDSRPGAGMASEPVPGRTPYTKDSEVMVGETSAWGRALAAIGAPTKGSIASRQEVANRKSPAVSEPAAERGVATKGEATQTLEPASPAGDTSSASLGGVEADSRPGEGQPKPSPGFPIDPSQCDHHLRSGNWVKWTSTDQCPKCGMSKLQAMEATTADLGPA